MDPALTRTAAALYTERAAKAQAARGRGGVSAAEATRHLRPWLAIACLAGADIHPLTDLIAERQVKRADGEWAVSPGEARILVAADLAEPRVWQPLLEAHRDQLLDALPQSGDPNSARFTRAAEVARLAAALGCRPYLPAAAQQRKAA